MSSTFSGRPRNVIVPGHPTGATLTRAIPETLISFLAGSLPRATRQRADASHPPDRLSFSGADQTRRVPPAALGQDKIGSRKTEVRALPGDVSVSDRSIVFPGDQIRRTLLSVLIEAIERQMPIHRLESGDAVRPRPTREPVWQHSVTPRRSPRARSAGRIGEARDAEQVPAGWTGFGGRSPTTCTPSAKKRSMSVA